MTSVAAVPPPAPEVPLDADADDNDANDVDDDATPGTLYYAIDSPLSAHRLTKSLPERTRRHIGRRQKEEEEKKAEEEKARAERPAANRALQVLSRRRIPRGRDSALQG